MYYSEIITIWFRILLASDSLRGMLLAAYLSRTQPITSAMRAGILYSKARAEQDPTCTLLSCKPDLDCRSFPITKKTVRIMPASSVALDWKPFADLDGLKA